MRRGLACLWMIAALAAAGCGGGDAEEQPAGGTPTNAAPAQDEAGGSAAAPGRQQFVATCGGCHALEAAGTNGQVGPNLDDVKPSQDEVLGAIKSGPGAMPENLLQGEDAQQVAEYVSSTSGG